MTALQWLLENGYEDIVAMIEEIVVEWRSSGRRTRRNWWVVLAGGKGGKPITVEGREFPVLVSAQIHEKVPVTANAIQRSKTEIVPPKNYLGKWAGKARQRKK